MTGIAVKTKFTIITTWGLRTGERYQAGKGKQKENCGNQKYHSLHKMVLVVER